MTEKQEQVITSLIKDIEEKLTELKRYVGDETVPFDPPYTITKIES